MARSGTLVVAMDLAVAMEQVSFSYGDRLAVDRLDLSVHAGEVVALLGPNGAGKSTTIGLLLGLHPVRTGRVRLFGTSPAEAVAAGRVAVTLQENRLLARATVRDLLEFMHRLYPNAMPVAEALERTDLTDVARREVDKLSGGQVQRTRFALALIGRPDLLVLDEPTAALDVEARREVWEVLRTFVAGGGTVLFSTHYLEEADDNADRIVVIAGGVRVAEGTPRQIKRLVPGRTVSVELNGYGAAGLELLPGVSFVEVRGTRAYLSSIDSDATVLALGAAGRLHDLEVTGANLEDAFVALTDRSPSPQPAA